LNHVKKGKEPILLVFIGHGMLRASAIAIAPVWGAEM
jgi:hypothetical protein